MPETDDDRRARQATMEQAARARLHGVEMPKRLDFTSKKVHHEYLCFKTLAKKVLECYVGLEDSVKVNKLLMWMGPEACVKHELHPFPPGDKEKLDPLWNLFDNLCSKKEGCQGSWNAARITLKFMKQDKGESVDIFYGRIRDVLHQCEYNEAIQKVLEAETLKYGLMNPKVIERIYALPKDVEVNVVLNTARAEEQAQTHIREVEKVRRDHNLGETIAQRSSNNRRNPLRKGTRHPAVELPRASLTARDVDANTVPNNALPTGKSATNAKRRAILLSSAVARENLILLARDPESTNRHLDPRRSFTKRLQTRKVVKETSQSMTMTRLQYRLIP